jgi:alpha-beta hydrolase superfamily lysophospholipase
MAKRSEYFFQSHDDPKTQIHAVRWLPEDDEYVGVLQICHGMQEYILRYDEFATYMADRGFVVVGHDHIGHGLSVRNQDELGIMHTDRPAEVMVEDILTNYEMTKREYPNLPYTILGHSMGSYLLRRFLSEKALSLSGLNAAIIMGTGTEADAAIKMGKLVVNMLISMKGRDHRSKFVANLMYGAPYKKYDVTGANPENSWLSKNVESIKAYYKDPYCTFVFPLQAYRGLVESTGYDNKMENIQKMRKSLPIFFVSGACDPVGNMGKGVQEAHDKFIEAGMEDVEIKLYPNDRHEILNELDRETVYNDIYQWMLSKMV